MAVDVALGLGARAEAHAEVLDAAVGGDQRGQVMSDDIALAAAEELGAVPFRDFVTALLVLEQRQRLRLAWERLYGWEARA